jgi:nickel-type superoxide dismutase maturation protease
MIRFLKVTGRSLEPRYREGDFVLVFKIPFSLTFYRPGDVVVFRHPLYGTLIKKFDHLADGELFVVGSAPESTDSRSFGTISKRAVIGKVIWHIQKERMGG